jgi:hypothetical protein
MENFNNIQVKLKGFIKKYYTNELIKGLILFSSFGLIYFIVTVLIEYFLWLKPLARTILFWVFIIVESILLFKYIMRPILMIIGVHKGMSLEKASELIGFHFKKVDDKLLNVMQLNDSKAKSELLMASIEQKSKELRPIPFKKAIDFNTNTKYLKYLAVPILIWLVTLVSGNIHLFTHSYERVLNYETVYIAPAPFSFHVINHSFDVIEGDSYVVQINIEGSVVPNDVSIIINSETRFAKNKGQRSFEYTFTGLNGSVSFYLEANNVRSKDYTLNVIKTPKILNFEMWLDYPSYTGKRDEVILNTGNAIVPVGTTILWKVTCQNTDNMTFNDGEETLFNSVAPNGFEFEKQLFNNLDYTVASNNKRLHDFESLSFSVKINKDGYPKINVHTDMDSIKSGPVQFRGQISDDYGISGLSLFYYDKESPSDILELDIATSNSSVESFYYFFPDGIELIDGIIYELYFEVFDNDRVNGRKSAKSKTFQYYKKTKEELNKQLLKEQGHVIKDLERTIEKNKSTYEHFKNFQRVLQNKSEMSWNDQKKLNKFVKRQELYRDMMQEQTAVLKQNLRDQPKSENESIEDQNRDLQKRLEEIADMSKQERILKELEELGKKLDKEKLSEKLEQLSENNRQNERSLERLLELTKHFYIEQKANEIKENIEKLSKKQQSLSESDANSTEKQEVLNAEFQEIRKDLNNLNKENKGLRKPMDLPKTANDEEKIDLDMKDARDALEENERVRDKEDPYAKETPKKNKTSASKKQKMAALKLQKMSQQMQNAMQSMEGESMDEDIDMLRAILENLVEFSFQQEDLLIEFANADSGHPEFAKKLKEQNVLKEYFEHIDDSLYTLALRQPKIGAVVFEELADAHFYLNETLLHLSDNRYNIGLADQQFVITATNNIAVLLSDVLNGLQNAAPSMGKGSGNSFSLPDIIQKQEEGIEKMKEGIKKNGIAENDRILDKDGENGESGEGNGEGERLNGELYDIFKEQQTLRQLLEDKLKSKNLKNQGTGENAVKQMEQLENELLEKGFSNEVLSKMEVLKYELMKLESASYAQGKDFKRESNVNVTRFVRPSIKDIKDTKLWINENELLIRQSLPLHPDYKEKVRNYFRVNDSIQ